jgi:hypothetical protein
VAASTYEIRISGTVPDEVADEFGEVQVVATAVSTVLSGELEDQAALLGLLARLRALGLTVLEVRHVQEVAADPPADPTAGPDADG